ncbi:MAG: STAS domain-containing protein [Syntrophaceae bacterium]|jgi:anti-sigma B factor antagonist|nr:STAS domain-containing protein [Syntrophaceae bacterium]HOC59607.1 STAS domain-containing protein [Smithellaceae bacterium]HQM45715.1 STAS domain-containing protein [Smithellaceae bacterium]
MDLKITVDKDRGRVEIIGDVDEKGAEILKSKLQEMNHLKTVEIDFRQVAYIGSSGIGKLLLFYKNLSIHGGTLSVTRLQPDIFRLFQELKLDTIFSITAQS